MKQSLPRRTRKSESYRVGEPEDVRRLISLSNWLESIKNLSYSIWKEASIEDIIFLLKAAIEHSTWAFSQEELRLHSGINPEKIIGQTDTSSGTKTSGQIVSKVKKFPNPRFSSQPEQIDFLKKVYAELNRWLILYRRGHNPSPISVGPKERITLVTLPWEEELIESLLIEERQKVPRAPTEKPAEDSRIRKDLNRASYSNRKLKKEVRSLRLAKNRRKLKPRKDHSTVF